MGEFVEFIRENYFAIVVIVFVVLFLLVIIELKGIELNSPKPESKLVQQVTVETFNNLDSTINLNPSDSFCETYLGNSSELETACNDLTEHSCSQTNCCVYSGKKCVAGNLDGPTYKKDKNGKLITADTYYYQGKCRGSCST